jgi:hypothetical protein
VTGSNSIDHAHNLIRRHRSSIDLQVQHAIGDLMLIAE